MQKRRSHSLLFPVCCLLLLLTSCGAVQGFPSPIATRAPSFKETKPLVIRPPLFGVSSVVWSPDGKRVAIANADGVFQVWEAATGRLISTRYDRDRRLQPSLLGWSADGKRIISTFLGPGMTVQVWDADTGNTLVTFGSSYPVAASHDGRYVAVGSGGSVQIWETSTGTQIATFDRLPTTWTISHGPPMIACSPPQPLRIQRLAQSTIPSRSGRPRPAS